MPDWCGKCNPDTWILHPAQNLGLFSAGSSLHTNEESALKVSDHQIYSFSSQEVLGEEAGLGAPGLFSAFGSINLDSRTQETEAAATQRLSHLAPYPLQLSAKMKLSSAIFKIALIFLIFNKIGGVGYLKLLARTASVEIWKPRLEMRSLPNLCLCFVPRLWPPVKKYKVKLSSSVPFPSSFFLSSLSVWRLYAWGFCFWRTSSRESQS